MVLVLVLLLSVHVCKLIIPNMRCCVYVSISFRFQRLCGRGVEVVCARVACGVGRGRGVIGLMDVPVPTTIEFKNTNLCSEIRSGFDWYGMKCYYELFCSKLIGVCVVCVCVSCACVCGRVGSSEV